ncbi:MAG: hypothetical protein QNJ47_12825 [Nostocaceae cyanobacterium]|nr:hypothetical protein [Nostocaceae cyanobacterium]
MIISFNPSIFRSLDTEIQSTLANILVALIDNNIHFIDIKSINAIFYNDNLEYIFDSNQISQQYFSLNHRRTLKDFVSKKGKVIISKLHEQHLKRIVIGIDENNQEVHPINAYKIITERSKVIVENGINDWKFIQGICRKYSSAKTQRKSIYQLLNKAIKNEYIEAENCGGVGELIKVTKRWIGSSRYQHIFNYKLMAIFDSDKQNLNSLTPHKNKIEYLKDKTITTIQPSDYEYESRDLIIWHILYKRKIENYIPLNVLFEKITSITQTHKTDLETKSNDDLDFIEYNVNNIGIIEVQVKARFPQMFLDDDFSYRDFEKRCEHHKIFLSEANEKVSEIEQILLKIAKII